MLTVIFQTMKEDRPKSEDHLQKVKKQLPANFKSDVVKLIKSIEEGIETAVSKLNFMITSLREENRHDIKNVNSKANKLRKCVGERIHEYVAKTKKIRNNINKELTKHKLETESDLTNYRLDISNVRQRVIEETSNAVKQKVDSAGRITASRLGAFSLKLDRFEQQLAAVYRQGKIE